MTCEWDCRSRSWRCRVIGQLPDQRRSAKHRPLTAEVDLSNSVTRCVCFIDLPAERISRCGLHTAQSCDQTLHNIIRTYNTHQLLAPCWHDCKQTEMCRARTTNVTAINGFNSNKAIYQWTILPINQSSARPFSTGLTSPRGATPIFWMGQSHSPMWHSATEQSHICRNPKKII